MHHQLYNRFTLCYLPHFQVIQTKNPAAFAGDGTSSSSPIPAFPQKKALAAGAARAILREFNLDNMSVHHKKHHHDQQDHQQQAQGAQLRGMVRHIAVFAHSGSCQTQRLAHNAA